MIYARETMDLLAAFPGRKFRMVHIVNYIAGAHADARQKKQVRMGVWRVLKALEESGHIEVETQSGRGASAQYAWIPTSHNKKKVLHAEVESTAESATI